MIHAKQLVLSSAIPIIIRNLYIYTNSPFGYCGGSGLVTKNLLFFSPEPASLKRICALNPLPDYSILRSKCPCNMQDQVAQLAFVTIAAVLEQGIPMAPSGKVAIVQYVICSRQVVSTI